MLKLMSIELVMPSNHLILCHPFLLPPSVFPSIRVTSNESLFHIRWAKYWSFSFNISPSNEGLDWQQLPTSVWQGKLLEGYGRAGANSANGHCLMPTVPPHSSRKHFTLQSWGCGGASGSAETDSCVPTTSLPTSLAVSLASGAFIIAKHVCPLSWTVAP